jgi:hypothetical protein
MAVDPAPGVGKNRHMRTPHRLASVLIVLVALIGGCGDDDDSDSSTTTVFTPTETTAVTGSPTSAPNPTSVAGDVVQGVTDGTSCSPQGARGVTRDGVAVICATAGAETRWRPA